MPVVIEYLLKLSLSLAFMYLFYQLLLRRLTFYQHNRIYLLVYSVWSFVIPFINISEILKPGTADNTPWINQVPSLHNLAGEGNVTIDSFENGFSFWTACYYFIAAGAIIMLIRLAIHLFSFYRIRQQSVKLLNDRIQIFQVEKDIIPFSFGRSIFINQQMHSSAELREIVRHEFVHVKQLHTIDIIWSELICIVNWYNPFAWLLRKAIRQNLEFIADNKVVQAGVDRKQYQYLLLKVMGSSHYSITNQFNFSSLKKRIAMMNKIKTSKVKLLRLLLLLPAIAITLLAFRQTTQQQKETGEIIEMPVTPIRPVVTDTPPTHNSKGYSISVKDRQGTCTVVVKDRNDKVVKSVLLTDWAKNSKQYEEMYGELPPPPPPKPPIPAVPGTPPVAPTTPTAPMEVIEEPLAPVPAKEIPINQIAPVPPLPPVVVELPANVKSIRNVDNKVRVELNDGKVENYDLNKPDQKIQFEKKYGKMPEPPKPPTAPVVSVENSRGYTFSIVDRKGECLVVIMNKNTTVRKVLLTEWNKNKGYFENLYGAMPDNC